MGEINEQNLNPGGGQENPIDLLSEEQRKDLDHIEEMQKGWSEEVNVRPKEMMASLLLQGLIPMVRDEGGRIIACFYEQPLSSGDGKDDKRVYRIGGLVSDCSFEARRTLFDLAAQETKKFSDGFGTAIINTGNSSVAKRLIELGWVEVTFGECREQYPRELELYLKDSGIPEENFRDEKFYVLK